MAETKKTSLARRTTDRLVRNCPATTHSRLNLAMRGRRKSFVLIGLSRSCALISRARISAISDGCVYRKFDSTWTQGSSLGWTIIVAQIRCAQS
jgi:hypothetical protein